MNPHIAFIAAAILLTTSPVWAGKPATNPLKHSVTWEDLREDVVGAVALDTSSAVLSLEAPYRAHDAATVPISLKQVDPGKFISAATVVVDENPAPIAGEFTFSKAMAPLDFELRVRVDQYSNVRVIAETQDGRHMTGRFVKASGGCSVPASKDMATALSVMGQIKVRSFEVNPLQSSPRREAQIMIRHPNFSGLQRNQVTQLFIPAHFIDEVEVWQGSEMLFAMEGGISISENPVFRFHYNDNGSTSFTIKASDTDGNEFETTLPKSPLS